MYLTQPSYNEIIDIIDENEDKISQITFTGGKAFELFKRYSNNFQTKLINEFQANTKGIEFLYNFNKKKALPLSLIVTFGTGTSITLRKDFVEHLGGTAMGGGFFMGLIKLFYDIDDYDEAIDLATKGNRYNVDLKVSDIYSPEDERVDRLFREFTAASLGKIISNIDLNSLQKEDILNSVISMLGENIGTIAVLMAINHNVENIIFCGGFLKNNNILKQILSILCKLRRIKPIFLRYSEFGGAIGALLS